MYWFISFKMCTMVDIDYLSAAMLLDFSLDLSSDDEKRKQTKFHLLKMKQISTERSRKGLTIGRNVRESPFYVE